MSQVFAVDDGKDVSTEMESRKFDAETHIQHIENIFHFYCCDVHVRVMSTSA